MGLEDLSMFRCLPNSVIFYPSDGVSSERVTCLAAEYEGLVYIRTSRPKTPVIYSNDETFSIGGSKVLRSSNNDQLTIATAGVTVHEALKAYESLKAKGILVRVIDTYCVKPIDQEGLLDAAAHSNNLVLVVEEHYGQGGLGDSVLNAIGNKEIQIQKMFVKDIPRSGKPDELLEYFGMSANSIFSKVREIL